jgi:DNA polymerase-3 subunit alpha
VGEAAVQSILSTRQNDGRFADIFDVARRVDGRQVNRKVFEALIKCGSLDSLGANRAQLLDGLESAMDAAARATRDRASGQASLFGDLGAAPETAPRLRALPAPPVLEQLGWEKETLGIFVSGHPLSDVAEALARTGATAVRDIVSQEDGAIITVAGMLISVRRTITKAQAQMLIAVLEDMSGSIEVIVFPKSYALLQASFVQDAIVIVKGRVNVRERRGSGGGGEEPPPEVSVLASEVRPFERRSVPAAPVGWHVTLRERGQADALAALLRESPGEVPIVLHVNDRSQRMPAGISNSVYVKSELEAIFGKSAVWEGPAA